jgi:starch synthase (maltosyl-transferring)
LAVSTIVFSITDGNFGGTTKVPRWSLVCGRFRAGGSRPIEPAEQTRPPALDGRVRVVVERVHPEVECGRFPVKRVIGDLLVVEADVFADGHDELSARVLYRHEDDSEWRYAAMNRLSGDRWRGEFALDRIGRYRYTVEGAIERFETWRRDLIRRIGALQELDVEFQIGAALIDDAAHSAPPAEAATLRGWADRLRHEPDRQKREAIAVAEDVAALVRHFSLRRYPGRFEKELSVVVDRRKARFSTWYEIFPRSCAPEPGRHGTLRDCESWLPYIAAMGFDVLYLPPIHPIGRTFRKGKNNVPQAGPDDVGSPWAIGAKEGGHTAIHPDLGSLDDFDHLLAVAAEYGMEIALDIAFQCTPDHPWVSEHPEWFRKRPDDTIQYAENPPKKYQDIYPLDFESAGWRALWDELHQVILFWIARRVRIFRVDNPHTKTFAFWEWVIAEVKERYPEVLFLAEAFTRPPVMYRLAKLGFSQSYTYFTWRNTKEEITRYFLELTQSEVREYFRPNLWPNTPDILPEYLQSGGRAAGMVRLVLAATLAGSYGIYGPAFELSEKTPQEPGSEEYLNSEKYELKSRDRNHPGSLREFIARVNRIRRENPALQDDRNLRFHDTDNPLVLCYSKATADRSNVVIVIVNLDAFHAQSGWAELDLAALGLDESRSFQAHDLLGAGRYLWHGTRVYFELAPETLPAHIIRVRRWVRTEKEFDYYL